MFKPNSNRRRSSSVDPEVRHNSVRSGIPRLIPSIVKPEKTDKLKNSTVRRQLFRSKSSLSQTNSAKKYEPEEYSNTFYKPTYSNRKTNQTQSQKVNNEEKQQIKIVENFIETQNAQFEVKKPTTLTNFIGITQLYFDILCNSSVPCLTNKNYKTIIPDVMKMFKYPNPISPSFLLTPNTTHNFHNVLSIWIYLNNLIEIITDESKDYLPSHEIEVIINYYVALNDVPEPQARLTAIESLYANNGFTQTELKQKLIEITNKKAAVLDEFKKTKEKARSLELTMQNKQNYCNTLCEKQKKVNSETQKLLDLMNKTSDQIKYNQNILVSYQSKMQEFQENLDKITEKNKLIGCTLNDIEDIDREIEITKHHKQLLTKRYVEYQQQWREVQNQNKCIEMQAMELIFAFNNKINRSMISDWVKNNLLLNEYEVDEKQIVFVNGHVDKLMNQVLIANNDYKVMLELLLKELEELKIQFEENKLKKNAREVKRDERTLLLEELVGENDEVLKGIDEEVWKITKLKEMYKLEVVDYKLVVETVKQHKANIEECVKERNCFVRKINEFIKEKNEIRRRKEHEMCFTIKTWMDNVNKKFNIELDSLLS